MKHRNPIAKAVRLMRSKIVPDKRRKMLSVLSDIEGMDVDILCDENKNIWRSNN